MAFDAYTVGVQLVTELRPVLEVLARSDRDLARQARRAATSIVLNLSEGNRRLGKDKVHFFSIASGSAKEVQTALEVSLAWGYLEAQRLAEVLDLLDRTLAMLWRLTHPRR